MVVPAAGTVRGAGCGLGVVMSVAVRVAMCVALFVSVLVAVRGIMTMTARGLGSALLCKPFPGRLSNQVNCTHPARHTRVLL